MNARFLFVLGCALFALGLFIASPTAALLFVGAALLVIALNPRRSRR